MSTSSSPTTYAEKIVTVLHSVDTNTARTALRIAEALLEHRVNAEAGISLDAPQSVAQSPVFAE